MRTLLVDVGNTSTAVGLSRGRRVAHVLHIDRGDGYRRRAERALAALVRRGGPIGGAALASVVPGLTPFWVRALRSACGGPPVVVCHTLALGVRVDYPAPETIGADRLANACGAAARYGTPVIVADFGTAVTFDLVYGGGVYRGGIIAPGLPLMTDYLAERTALLPWIRLKGPHGPIGRSTVTAMRLGAKIGYRGMVKEITRYLLSLPGLERARLCATGGFAGWVLEGIDLPYVLDPDLTLFGLGRIYALNRPPRA